MDEAKARTPLRKLRGRLIDKIRKRKEQHKELSFEQSEYVTREYILRMTRRMSNKSHRVNSTANHKLSEVLKRKIFTMRTQGELIKRHLLDIQRKKEDQEKERNLLRELVLDKLGLLQILRTLLQNRNAQTSGTGYSEVLRREREKNSQLSIEMLKETLKKKENQDKRILIAHWSSQLNMENVLLGDSLKLLFYSLSTVSETTTIVTEFKQYALQLTACKEGFTHETHSLLKDSKSLSLNSITLLGEYEDLYKKLPSKKHSIGMNLLEIKRNLLEVKATEKTQKKVYKSKLDSYSNLETLFNSAKSLQASRENRKDEQEITCRNCLGEYQESQNTQNSCRVHPGGWNGQIFWCCASTSQGAPPCLRTKHLPINFSNNGKVTKRLDFSNEKDPNIRTGFDGKSELERIYNMRLSRHRRTVPCAVPATESALKSSSIKTPRK